MGPHEALEASLANAQMILKAYIGDMSDADILVRPLPGMNHIAWQMGHLVVSENQLMSEMCPDSMPALPDGFAEKYTKETAGSDDASQFLSKQEYVDLYEQQRDGTLAVLKTLSADDLSKPGPEKYRDFVPTVGATVAMQGAHELMHVGQFVAVRRALDKPIVI